jgi:hypothetical protein
MLPPLLYQHVNGPISTPTFINADLEMETDHMKGNYFVVRAANKGVGIKFVGRITPRIHSSQIVGASTFLKRSL